LTYSLSIKDKNSAIQINLLFDCNLDLFTEIITPKNNINTLQILMRYANFFIQSIRIVEALQRFNVIVAMRFIKHAMKCKFAKTIDINGITESFDYDLFDFTTFLYKGEEVYVTPGINTTLYLGYTQHIVVQPFIESDIYEILLIIK